MNQDQAAARLQQKVEEVCAATIRALSGRADLHFRGRRLHQGAHALPLFAPHLHPRLGQDDIGSFRGAADGLALRVSRSDLALHRSLAPAEPLARLLFDILEQIRVESLADAAMPGVTHNLAHRFERWSLGFHDAGLADSARGILLYTVVQMCRARVLGVQVVEATEDLLETTRGALGPLLGHELAGLRRTRADQAAYARHALVIAHAIAEMDAAARDEDEGDATADAEADPERAAYRLLMDPGPDAPDSVAGLDSGRSVVLAGSPQGYRVHTRAYDRVVRAGSLARPALLRELRVELDRRIAQSGFNRPRLARELQALLARPRADGWDDAQEEGRIDGRRLAAWVAAPTERRIFRTVRQPPCADAAVSFLIDCSGSMKAHMPALTPLVDVFARALEEAGIACEVLGHTTGAWNGGRARRDWLRAGSPAHPGRLNELDLIVFKDADTPWRRARANLAALLKTDLFREGIDGEAVEWACRRLRTRDAARRLLVVVSDGCPMDTATHLANDAWYLDNHLQQVVAEQSRAGDVEIMGLGVGLDLSLYYAHCHALDLSAPPGHGVCREVLTLLAGRHRR